MSEPGCRVAYDLRLREEEIDRLLEEDEDEAAKDAADEARADYQREVYG